MKYLPNSGLLLSAFFLRERERDPHKSETQLLCSHLASLFTRPDAPLFLHVGMYEGLGVSGEIGHEMNSYSASWMVLVSCEIIMEASRSLF